MTAPDPGRRGGDATTLPAGVVDLAAALKRSLHEATGRPAIGRPPRGGATALPAAAIDAARTAAGEMSRKYRKKPVVIEAVQWHRNGDHPDDNCRLIEPEPGSTTQFEPFLSEGAVVRYYRQPDIPDETPCRHCGVRMHAHGWIDTLEGGHVVCPGDWVITGVQGERYPCKPAIFEATYEAAGDES